MADALRYKTGSSGFDSRLTQFFRPYNGPGFNSAYQRNKFQEYFWGIKVTCAWADNLATLMWRLFQVWEPQPPRTLRACLGSVLWIALTFITKKKKLRFETWCITRFKATSLHPSFPCVHHSLPIVPFMMRNLGSDDEP